MFAPYFNPRLTDQSVGFVGIGVFAPDRAFLTTSLETLGTAASQKYRNKQRDTKWNVHTVSSLGCNQSDRTRRGGRVVRLVRDKLELLARIGKLLHY